MVESVGMELKKGDYMAVAAPQLSELQTKFLSARPSCKTDKEAALQVGIHPQTVNNWKANGPPFPEEYKKITTGLAQIHDDAVEDAVKRIREMFPKALAVLADLCESKSEHVRIKAVELILSRGGVAAMQDVNLQVHGRLEAHLIALRQIGEDE